MLKAEHIDGMFEAFSHNNSDSMFTGVVEKQFKWGMNLNGKEGLSPINYDYKNRPRRQDFEGLIAENGACYINSVGNIKRDKCSLSGKISACELPSYTLYELDEPVDWIIVEEIMKNIQQF